MKAAPARSGAARARTGSSRDHPASSMSSTSKRTTRVIGAQPQSAERAGAPRWLAVASIAGTLAAIALRLLAAYAAGPLWRDEAGSASTATVPTLAEFWSRQHFDSFPLLWQLLLRAWTTTLWNGGDTSIRTLGL